MLEVVLMTAALSITESNKPGRPSPYSEAIAQKIIDACRSGFTMEKAAELVGLEHKTVQGWVSKRPAFGSLIKKARKEHELSLLRSIEVAGEKSWQARAWLAERVYNYAQPSSRVEVAGAIAHGASPALAQMLAGLNTKPVNDSVMIEAQTVDHQPKLLSVRQGQKKVRRYSKRPTKARHHDTGAGQPPPPPATHIPPLSIPAKNKKASDASTSTTNTESQEGAQQAA